MSDTNNSEKSVASKKYTRNKNKLYIETPRKYAERKEFPIENKKLEKALRGENLKGKNGRGRDGFAVKAVKLGVYDEICDWLYTYRERNGLFTDRRLADDLIFSFPQVFEGCSKYSQNIRKAIDHVDDWRNALGSDEDSNIDRRNLALNKLNTMLYDGYFVNGKDGSTNVDMAPKDVINYVKLLNEMEDRQEKVSTDMKYSNETMKTIITVNRSLSPDEEDEDEE